MIRKYFHKFKRIEKDRITWRSHEVTRIEALSDAVFAFAVSLLIISLEVPKTSTELLASLKGMVPFGICFVIIFWVWREQYKFFRRYGLHDNITLFLNGVLLLMILGYVYPLKFLFSSIFLPDTYKMVGKDLAKLMILYNAGFLSIGLLFAAMYFNAYMKRDAIRLTPTETFETVTTIWSNIFPACVASLAVVAAYNLRNEDPSKITVSYLAYGLLGIIMPLYDKMRDRAFKKKFGNVPVVDFEHNPEG